MNKGIIILIVISFIIACSDKDFPHEQNEIPELDLVDFTQTSGSFDRIGVNDKAAALGRILFYDNRLSHNNTIACADCHKQGLAFADNSRFSTGLNSESTIRNSIGLTNVRYYNFLFWEGQSENLDELVLNPVSNHLEMGMRNLDDLEDKLSSEPQYVKHFQEVYRRGIDKELISDALTEFVRSLVSGNSKYDKGLESDFSNFSLSELNGIDLFFGKALCSECHKGRNFTATWRSSANIGLDKVYDDQGAGNGEFKVPGLRNVELTAPYMHDGRFNTLEQVVDHYVNGVQDHPQLDWSLKNNKIELNEVEQLDLVAFLKTLTDHDFIVDSRYTDPFD